MTFDMETTKAGRGERPRSLYRADHLLLEAVPAFIHSSLGMNPVLLSKPHFFALREHSGQPGPQGENRGRGEAELRREIIPAVEVRDVSKSELPVALAHGVLVERRARAHNVRRPTTEIHLPTRDSRATSTERKVLGCCPMLPHVAPFRECP